MTTHSILLNSKLAASLLGMSSLLEVRAQAFTFAMSTGLYSRITSSLAESIDLCLLVRPESNPIVCVADQLWLSVCKTALGDVSEVLDLTDARITAVEFVRKMLPIKRSTLEQLKDKRAQEESEELSTLLRKYASPDDYADFCLDAYALKASALSEIITSSPNENRWFEKNNILCARVTPTELEYYNNTFITPTREMFPSQKQFEGQLLNLADERPHSASARSFIQEHAQLLRKLIKYTQRLQQPSKLTHVQVISTRPMAILLELPPKI